MASHAPTLGTLLEIPLNKLVGNPWDPRSSRNPEAIREMADSILKVGLLQPLVVRPAGDGGYQMAFGMTRWEAIKLLSKEGQWTGGIPCEVRQLSDSEMAVMSLEENSRRKDLTPLEKFRAYQHALDSIPDLSITHLADSLGLDRSTLSNNLRLLQLPYVVLERVESGEMSAHAAREFLCLVAEDHAHEDIMESIIKEVCNTQWGTGPDWRGDNMRRLIRDRVRGSTVEHWRRLGTLKGTTHNWPDYGNSHRTGPLFDVKAFEKDFPQGVHLIPWDDWTRDDRGYRVTKEFTLPFTCEVKEWERRQAATKRTAEAQGERPAPKEVDVALLVALKKDPVARQIARQASAPVSTETPPGADNVRPDVQAARTEERGDTVPPSIPAARITPEQKEKLGSRARVVKLSGYRGFHRSLVRQGYQGPPVYFPELDECLKQCIKGATYCPEWGGNLALHCLNETCWKEKEARGLEQFKKTVAARAEREDREDQELAQAMANQFKDADLPRLVATTLVLSQGDFTAYIPDGLREAAYEPQTIAAVRKLLSLPVPRKAVHYPHCLADKNDVIAALKKAPADRLPHVAAQLLVYTLRAHDPKAVGVFQRRLGEEG